MVCIKEPTLASARCAEVGTNTHNTVHHALTFGAADSIVWVQVQESNVERPFEAGVLFRGCSFIERNTKRTRVYCKTSGTNLNLHQFRLSCSWAAASKFPASWLSNSFRRFFKIKSVRDFASHTAIDLRSFCQPLTVRSWFLDWNSHRSRHSEKWVDRRASKGKAFWLSLWEGSQVWDWWECRRAHLMRFLNRASGKSWKYDLVCALQ